MHAHPRDCHPSGELSIDANAGAGFCSAPIHVYMSAGADEVGVSSQESTESTEDAQQRREHLSSALHALQTILEAQPRLSAIMASVAALAPICNCIEPICR